MIWNLNYCLSKKKKEKTFTQIAAQLSLDMILVKGVDVRKGIKTTLSDFRISKFPITQEVWLSVMKRNPSNFKGGSLPVDQVSWNDVQDFLKRLNSKTDQNYRLPTEIEWEFAARGGTNSQAYEFAGSNSLEKVGWYALNSGNRTHPVGEKEPNELGIFDMSGNVWEWCQDWYGRSRKKDKTNPKEPRNGKRRVLRGGCWGSNTEGCQVSNRGGNDPDSRINICGFRIAQSV